MPVVFSSRFVATPSNTIFTLTALWPDPLPDSTVDAPYSYQLTAAGGVPPYTYSISAGSLPAGLSLNGSTGVISGTPSTQESLQAVTFQVTDSGP
jgi:hypothetical protein